VYNFAGNLGTEFTAAGLFRPVFLGVSVVPTSIMQGGINTPASASIFVLEDEVLIRMMIVQMLEELGHRVVAEAGSLTEGLSLAETAEFDLALLDINVGGYTSEGIAQIVERRGLPILFVTGYISTGLPPPFSDRRVLQKPFPIEALKKAIDDAWR
jgi:CheY-like chemotaxis protein